METKSKEKVMVQLDRPLVIFDIETTGTNPSQDKIVQLAAIKVTPQETEEEFEWLINPECEIPQDVQAIHGISNEDVVFEPSFKDLAYEILTVFKGSDLLGYNAIKFDVPFLCKEFKEAGIDLSLEDISIVDPYLIYKLLEPHTLSRAYKYYCHKPLKNAHTALVDARATWDVFKAQSQLYEEMPQKISEIVTFCKEKRRGNAFDDDRRLNWVNSELALNFGKYKGKTLRDLVHDDEGYLKWLLNQDLSDRVKSALRLALEGKPIQR